MSPNMSYFLHFSDNYI